MKNVRISDRFLGILRVGGIFFYVTDSLVSIVFFDRFFACSASYLRKTDPAHPPKLVVNKYEAEIRTDRLPEERESFWIGELILRLLRPFSGVRFDGRWNTCVNSLAGDGGCVAYCLFYQSTSSCNVICWWVVNRSQHRLIFRRNRSLLVGTYMDPRSLVFSVHAFHGGEQPSISLTGRGKR